MVRAAVKENPPGTRLASWPKVASILVFVFGGLVLVGWSFQFEAVRNFFAGLVAMKVNTALAFVLSGVSLWLLRGRSQDDFDLRRASRRQLLAGSYAVVVILIGLVTLAEDLLGWDLGIDPLVFGKPSAHSAGLQPGRMGGGTALSFVMIGAALLLLDAPRCQRLVRLFLALVALASLLALSGVPFGVRLLFGSGPATAMTFPTALGLLVLSTGLFCVHLPSTQKEMKKP